MDMEDLKGRLSSVKPAVLMVKRQIVHGDEVDARLLFPSAASSGASSA